MSETYETVEADSVDALVKTTIAKMLDFALSNWTPDEWQKAETEPTAIYLPAMFVRTIERSIQINYQDSEDRGKTAEYAFAETLRYIFQQGIGSAADTNKDLLIELHKSESPIIN